MPSTTESLLDQNTGGPGKGHVSWLLLNLNLIGGFSPHTNDEDVRRMGPGHDSADTSRDDASFVVIFVTFGYFNIGAP